MKIRIVLLLMALNLIPSTYGNEAKLINAALVLEGGSLRSIYTSGVLDVFLENDIQFSSIIAVSAGALNAGNYIANHRGRSARINILHSNDRNYFGIRQYLFTGNIFNFDYVFYSPIKDLYPYDEEAFENSKVQFYIGATNMKTAEIEYFQRDNYDELVHILRASSSIPLLCKPVNIEGSYYLDGAIADPIGIEKARSLGYDKIVIVLTRTKNFRTPKTSWFLKLMFRLFYRNKQELVSVLNSVPETYNALIDELNALENDGQIFIIRPTREIKIGRVERNARRLTELYILGREDAGAQVCELLNYLE